MVRWTPGARFHPAFSATLTILVTLLLMVWRTLRGPRLPVCGLHRPPCTKTPSAPVTCAAYPIFSFFNNVILHTFSISYPAKVLLGLFFFMAVWCTNTSSLVSFLLTKPHPSLTLNYLAIPKTLCAKPSRPSCLHSSCLCKALQRMRLDTGFLFFHLTTLPTS